MAWCRRVRPGGSGLLGTLPLTISLGQHGLVTMSAAVAGGVIAFYQVGYGIAAFGVGRLVDRESACQRCTAGLRSLPAPWPCCPLRSQDAKLLRGSCTHGLRATNSQQIQEARPMNVEQSPGHRPPIG